jgi:hypothetical protein
MPDATTTCGGNSAGIWSSVSHHQAIRRHLTDDSAKILVHAFVLWKLDYCNPLFVGLLKKDIHRLQVIKNTAARLIFRKKPSDDATDFSFLSAKKNKVFRFCLWP